MTLVLHVAAWLALALPALVFWHELVHVIAAKAIGAHNVKAELFPAWPHVASIEFDFDEEKGLWKAVLVYLAPHALDLGIVSLAVIARSFPLDLRFALVLAAGVDYFLSLKDLKAAWAIANA